MKKVTLSKMEHKGITRIRVDFPYDSAILHTIKQLEGSRWSQSKKCWHLPYTKEAYAALQKHFDTALDSTSSFAIFSLNDTKQPVASTSTNHSEELVRVAPEHAARVKVFVPKQRKDWIQLIKSLPNRAWNQEQKYWSVPKTEPTLFLLQQHFGKSLQVAVNIVWKLSKSSQQDTISTSTPSVKDSQQNLPPPQSSPPVDALPISNSTSTVYQKVQKDGRVIKTVVGQQIIIEQANASWLRAFVPYDKKGWIAIIKDIPGRKWNKEEKYWLLPYVQDTFKRMKQLIGSNYLEITFQPIVDIPEVFKKKRSSSKKRSSIQLKEVQQKALIALEGKMKLENKGWRTQKTYLSLFRRFLAHFPNTEPSSITKEQIEQYIIFKKQDNISDSQLNQLLNTLNCFYIRLLDQKEKVVQLERPKKKRKLPNVYAVEELQLLLKASDNLKHKCMLLLIYSGGLRRSELLDLKVEDINFHRNTIFVRNGKGGKDRYTLFSEKAQKHVKEYIAQYRPRYYLFEGQHGGRYSESSIQKVFDNARKKSRVPSNVTIHGLRHSFTSHMMEKGVPLKAIQDLLGHASIKTTEGYLHLSNKFRREIRSPLDDLDI